MNGVAEMSLRPNKTEREHYEVDYSSDTEFSVYARLLQSKWRVGKGYPKGKLGNYLEPDFARQTRGNFLTERIALLVEEEIRNSHTTGALIREPRIWDNLLSSQPLCFNLFGELSLDLEQAGSYFRLIFPERIDEVTAVKFEYSPGRRNPKYTNDRSAFDVFIEYLHKGKRGFIGIEVKYAESLREETQEKAKKNHKPIYDILSRECGLFRPDTLQSLKEPPVSQIWRDYLLSVATRKDYEEGFFVFLYPSLNEQCRQGAELFSTCFKDSNEAQTGFYARTLEVFVDALLQVSNEDWTMELKKRYLG